MTGRSVIVPGSVVVASWVVIRSVRRGAPFGRKHMLVSGVCVNGAALAGALGNEATLERRERCEALHGGRRMRRVIG
ncbi:MAG: hypothetical protein DIU78_006470 [Pseudomonadota bacterium]